MQKIIITERFELCNDDPSLEVFKRVRDTNIVKLSLTNIKCNCDIDSLFSRYVSANGLPITYGVPLSALDRSIELAVSVMNDRYEAQIEIRLDGKYVGKQFEKLTINFECSAKLQITDDSKEIYEWSDDDKEKYALSLKMAGVQLITTDKCYAARISAFILFTKALKLLSFITESSLSTDASSLELQCLLNISYLHLSFSNYEKVVALTAIILAKNEGNIKALYRRGVSHLHLQNYELAQTDLETVLKANPKDKLVLNHLKLVNTKQKELNFKYSIGLKKMFS